jgi:hypothetical protein
MHHYCRYHENTLPAEGKALLSLPPGSRRACKHSALSGVVTAISTRSHLSLRSAGDHAHATEQNKATKQNNIGVSNAATMCIMCSRSSITHA